MKIKFTGWIHGYYFVVFLLAAGFIVYGSRHFMVNGNVLSVYEAAVRFDKLEEEEGQLAGAKSLVGFSRSEEASAVIAFLIKETRFLDSVVPLESYKDLKLHLDELDHILTKLPSSEQLASLQRKLYEKASGLEKLANERQWEEFEGVFKRMGAKIQDAKFFGLNNVSQFLKSVDEDVRYVGEAVEKKPILKSVNLGREMGILNQYVEDLKSISSAWERAEKSYVTWRGGVAPEISLKKINLSKTFENIFWGMVALLCFFLVACGGGIFVGKILEKSIRKKFEVFATRIIKDGIFPVERKIDIKLSQDFEAEFVNLRAYFHKRLGFGSMVQEAMPFPILLLDSNLNLLWANKLFYEKWGINNNEIPLSWDYLLQFTDLKGKNPALEALKGEVAGIYNIKILIKSSNEKMEESVEMYVNPVNYGKKKRVMVLFYPLGSLEAIIEDKTKDIIGPVVKTLDTFEKGDFGQTMAEDFARVGIGDVFENFNTHYQFLEKQRNQLNVEMGKVENILDDQHKLSSEFKMLLKSDEEVMMQSLHAFARFKNSLINIIGMREQLEKTYRESVHVAQNLLEENDQIWSGYEKIVDSVNANKEIFRVLLKVGDKLKKADGAEEASKNIQQLNVILSKAAMLLDESNVPKSGRPSKRIRQTRDFFQEGVQNLDRMGDDFRRADDMMINCLKEFHTSFKNLQNNVEEMGRFVGKLDDLNKNYTHPTSIV